MNYVHESNIENKIKDNYKKCRKQLEEFRDNVYKPFRKKIESINYESEDIKEFNKAAKIIDDYFFKADEFAKKYKVTPQSKFRPSAIEELSVYLFANLPLIKDGTLGIFNKGIFAGMKINNQMQVDIIKKDVDFCIGKKVDLVIGEGKKMDITIPIVCVEAKTYLDATMFGEVQFSSEKIKSASPNAKTYVLMENNEVAEEKILAARYDNNLNEMFALREGKRENNSKHDKKIDGEVLLDYYREIKNNVENIELKDTVKTPGRLLSREEEKLD